MKDLVGKRPLISLVEVINVHRPREILNQVPDDDVTGTRGMAWQKNGRVRSFCHAGASVGGLRLFLLFREQEFTYHFVPAGNAMTHRRHPGLRSGISQGKQPLISLVEVINVHRPREILNRVPDDDEDVVNPSMLSYPLITHPLLLLYSSRLSCSCSSPIYSREMSGNSVLYKGSMEIFCGDPIWITGY
ncbi:MAG: hypothetical protein R3281_00205 [Balneolaceae bacterium]|nr:hypothetical protein [Balneolaceae bacterium]